MVIRALENIEVGKELYLSYIDNKMPYTERKSKLLHWGFQCKCQACCSPSQELSTKESQNLFKKIKQSQLTPEMAPELMEKFFSTSGIVRFMDQHINSLNESAR